MIYLDHNAATLLRPEAAEEMRMAEVECFANPSSLHRAGQKSKAKLEECRERIAARVGCAPGELFFTSGGTESNNLALRGALRALRQTQIPELWLSGIEHSSVIQTAKDIASCGEAILRWVPVDRSGAVCLDRAEIPLSGSCGLLSVMQGNHETGILQPIASAVEWARKYGFVFHSDASQSFVKQEESIFRIGADLVTLSSHKIGGPRGIGGLVIRKKSKVAPLFFGGPQEKNMRPGTESTVLAAGFAAAVEIAAESTRERLQKYQTLREVFMKALRERGLHPRCSGEDSVRLPHVISIAFRGVTGVALAMRCDLDGVYFSTGAACTAMSVEPSPVLIAMGMSPDEAGEFIRISMGPDTTVEELLEAAKVLCSAVGALTNENGKVGA